MHAYTSAYAFFVESVVRIWTGVVSTMHVQLCMLDRWCEHQRTHLLTRLLQDAHMRSCVWSSVHLALGNVDSGIQLVVAWCGGLFLTEGKIGVLYVSSLFLRGWECMWVCVCVYTHTHTHTAQMGYSVVSLGGSEVGLVYYWKVKKIYFYCRFLTNLITIFDKGFPKFD